MEVKVSGTCNLTENAYTLYVMFSDTYKVLGK
jgi:hypothetical protein